MNRNGKALSNPDRSATTKVVVASTVMLSFISMWRAAAIVLNDLGSSVYYAGGIAEQAIGRSAPWFIMGVMLFSFAVRSVYMESSSMFVRGGVYVVVRDAMGSFVARLSVSALLFDYILTGPISSVSAGQYLGRLINEAAASTRFGIQVSPDSFAVIFAIAVTLYFWWQNIKGIPESSTKALRIMQVMTVMVVMFLVWCSVTLIARGTGSNTAGADACKSAIQPGKPRMVSRDGMAHNSNDSDHNRIRPLHALHERL